MPTSAKFFVGKGKSAHCIGGQYSDGYPPHLAAGGVPEELILADDESKFRKTVLNHLGSRDRGDIMKDAVGSPWSEANGYDFVYAFFNGHVWITNWNGIWFNPLLKIKPPKSFAPAPIGRKGVLEGEFTVSCGACGCRFRVTTVQLSHCYGSDWHANYVDMYWKDKGFRKIKKLGWVCPGHGHLV